MSGERRVRMWPAAVLTGVFVLVGVWAFIGVQARTGLTPSVPEVRRVGTADIRSCERDPLTMWLTYTCFGTVQWRGEQPAEKIGKITAVGRFEGTINIRDQHVSRKNWRVLSADVPVKADGALFFLVMMGFLSFGLAGWLAGYRIAKRWLPEPPQRPRELTLKSKMSGKWDRDVRFNGPRRRRRR